MQTSSFATINEIREKWDLEPIEELGDIIENSIFHQAYTQKKQAEMQQQQQSMGGGGENPFGAYEEGGEDEEWNPFDDYEDKEDEESGENGTEAGENEEAEEDTDDEEEKAEQSVFVKAFESFLAKEEESINKE